jgi:hypothetical protein
VSATWDNVGTLPVRPPGDLDDHDVVVTDQGTYWECGDTDWHLMLGWFAGPETLMRYPDDRTQFWTVTTEDDEGNRQISRRYAADGEHINERLRARGLPERPGGFRWFQLVPPGGTGSDVMAVYFRVQRELPRRYDVTWETAYVRAAVEELYGRPITPPPPIPPEAWEPEPEDPRDAADRRAEQARLADVMAGPLGAVPILRCRNLERSLRFYATLGFDAEELSGYAVLRNGTTELHLSRTADGGGSGGCLIRVSDAAALWRQLQDQDMLGPLEDGRFTLLDPDGNHLMFASVNR